MLYRIIKSAIQYRKVTLFTVILTAFFGVYSYHIAPKQEAPEIEAPIAVITTLYPGASPEDVDLMVTDKIEDEIATIRGFDYSTSTSTEGLSIVVMRLHQDANIDKAWEDLRLKMRDLQGRLPHGVEDIDINVDLADTAGFILAVSGDSNEQLVAYGELIRQQLRRVNGVSRIDLEGEAHKEIQVAVDMDQLFYLPLSLDAISQRLQLQNTDLPSGNLQNNQSRIPVKTPQSYETIEDIKETILLASESGSILRLRDIAEINVVHAEDNQRIYHNGREAILLTGYFKDNVNIVHVGAEIDKHLSELIEQLPAHIDVSYVLNQPRDVDQAVKEFVTNLLLGMAFVMTVVFLGMGFRNAIVVSTAIPIAILITLGAMRFLGVEIHQISIVALIIALGMLVDNAIVISDTIQVRLDRGEERLHACIEGVRDVAMPVGTSTLTTIAAFLPLLLLPNVAGEYIRSLPLIVIVSLSASYLIAILVTPTLAYLFFKPELKESKSSPVRALFLYVLTTAMRWRVLTILCLVAVIGLAGFTVTQLGLQFFPKADKQLIHIDITAERFGDLDYTESLAFQVEDIINEFSEVTNYTTVVGAGLPKFFNTMNISIPSQDFAQIAVELDLSRSDFVKNTQLVELLQSEINQMVTGGTVIVTELEQGEPIGSPVRLRVYGEDLDYLYSVANEIQLLLEDIEGTTNVHSNVPKKSHELFIDVDDTRAAIVGISKYDIQREISNALRGREATVLRQSGKEYPVIIKSDILALDSLERIGITSSVTGSKTSLKDLAEIRIQQQIPAINKYNKDKSVTIYSDVLSGYNPVRIQEQLEQRLLTANIQGVGIAFDGEREKINEYFGEIGYSAIFAVLLIFGILLVQFHSFSQPLLILITIPLSATGSIVGLYLFQQPLSFTAMLGIVSLFGIVVNNAIVLVDYINRERSNNVAIQVACYEAVEKRIRPILLSTITTTMGLVPLVLSGSELFRPLSISIMSGLLVSTLLTIIVLPVFYTIVESRLNRQPTLANERTQSYEHTH
ncbi:efflux RND transporter permease subunit [Desulfuribacillus alkaliarsenatis]|uniref:Acriflavin resistance protein n=1 Tax=Desulfuribacillus alkaliarsenatis TaxID=766136 RepID=A0A1E5G3H4_9FIRM|nr:efflux RND transporter permease subunit [Desulfuribacillus alkaliarsenatis]OEF97520.1 hypothetical protein BHF68_04760 [Desulfuribacillus alkaliarsenatis]